MADFSSCSLEEMIEVMTTWPAGVPVRAMERVLALGEAAIPALGDALPRWQTGDSRDLLWPIVLPGNCAIPARLSLWSIRFDAPRRKSWVWPPRRARSKSARLRSRRSVSSRADTDSIVRIYGYAGLGWLRHDEAYSVLLHALCRDLELGDAVAQALSDQGRKEAIPALYDAY